MYCIKRACDKKDPYVANPKSETAIYGMYTEYKIKNRQSSFNVFSIYIFFLFQIMFFLNEMDINRDYNRLLLLVPKHTYIAYKIKLLIA